MALLCELFYQYSIIVKSIAMRLVFDAKIQPSEIQKMPLSVLLDYNEMYSEYIRQTTPKD